MRLLLLLFGLACARDLSVPAQVTAVVIDKLEPHAAFAGESVRITGTGFDSKPQNNQVHFIGGLVASADLVEDGQKAIWVTIPRDVRLTGPITVTGTAVSSAPSKQDFVPLGYGHPIFGSGVAELRFRHQPVGLVDSPEFIMVASTLFDAIINDTGRFTWLEGRPAALVRAEQGGGGLLSLRSKNGGIVEEFDVHAGTFGNKSALSDVVDQWVMPLPAAEAPLVARSIGIDSQGQPFISKWTRSGSALVPTRAALAVGSVLGAAQTGDTVAAVVSQLDGTLALTTVDDAGGVTVVWNAITDPDDPAIPSGQIVLTRLPASGKEAAVLALVDGDLATVPLDGSGWSRTSMISFNAISDVHNALADAKVLVTKPLDGALFQIDAETNTVDWATQVRGEPGPIDLAPDLTEISVANTDDNAVDVVSLAGVWLGRSSLSLALGSDDDGEGGMVAPYSYDPDQPKRKPVMQLLARTAPMVIDLEPNSLALLGHHTLDDQSPPLRLAVTPDLRTLVVHTAELGMLLDDGTERVVTPSLPARPTAIDFLRDGRVLLASATRVAVYQWNGEDLALQGSLQIPAGAVVSGIVSHRARILGRTEFGDGGRDWLLVTWRLGAGLGGAFYTVPAAPGAAPIAPDSAIHLGSAGDPVGLVDLEDGPAALFGLSSLPGPALLTAAALRGEKGPLNSLADSPLVTRATPDGRFLVWVNQGPGEHVVRVMLYGDNGLEPFAGYRFDAHAAGPGLDPSGEWLYVPVPKLDMLSVQQ